MNLFLGIDGFVEARLLDVRGLAEVLSDRLGLIPGGSGELDDVILLLDPDRQGP